MATVIFAVLMVLAPLTPGAHAQRSDGPKRNTVMSVEVTAYCVEGQTASGERTRRGIVAADPAVLPLGTVIRVQGLARRHNRTYRVEDTGRNVKGRVIDIFMSDCDAAKDFGRQHARVRVVQTGGGGGG